MKATNCLICCLLPCLVVGSVAVASDQTSNSLPKLSGVARIGDHECVVLEVPLPFHLGTFMNETMILHAGERRSSIEVKSISLMDATAELAYYGSNVIVRLDAAHPTTARNQINLTNAPLLAVVDLYARAAGRTILLHPLVPATRLAIAGSADDPATVAQIVAQAMTNHGIVSIPDGEKFLQLVPERLADKVQPRSAELKLSKPGGATETSLPAGSINLIAAKMSQVARIYASLIGREFDLESFGAMNRPFQDVAFKSHTALTTSEMIYALDVQLAWCGVKMVVVDDKRVRLAPLNEQ